MRADRRACGGLVNEWRLNQQQQVLERKHRLLFRVVASLEDKLLHASAAGSSGL